MAGERRTKTEDERDDVAGATPEDRPIEQAEPAVESEDPTLRVMASEFAIFGLKNNGRHVHGDEPG